MADPIPLLSPISQILKPTRQVIFTCPVLVSGGTKKCNWAGTFDQDLVIEHINEMVNVHINSHSYADFLYTIMHLKAKIDEEEFIAQREWKATHPF